jgi:branched-chain amino acid transport system permease protein
VELSNFQILTQYFVSGVPFGALVALIAVGYTMVYGIIQLVNFAHGEIFMFAAYFVLTLLLPASGESLFWAQSASVILMVTWSMSLNVFLPLGIQGWPRRIIALIGGVAVGAAMYPVFCSAVPFWLAYPLAIVHTATLGVTIDRVAYLPLREAPRLTALITAIGVSFFLFNLAQGIWEARPRPLPEAAFPEGSVTHLLLGPSGSEGMGLSWWQTVVQTGRIPITGWLDTNVRDVLILLICIATMAGLQWLIHRTRVGKAMRACSMDKTTSRLVGINVDYVVAVTFAVGSAMAAIAAPLYVLRGPDLLPTMGYIVGLLAFASAVLGGIGNIPGALIGGFMIGTITSMAPCHSQLHWPAWMPTWWVEMDLTQWGYGIAYGIMILVIIFRPSGILGKATATRA